MNPHFFSILTHRNPFGVIIHFMRLCFKISLLTVVSLSSYLSFSQVTFFGESAVKWKNIQAPISAADTGNYGRSDLLILNDNTEFHFYSSTNEKLIRSVTFKINTQKGLDILEKYKLPESFDEVFDTRYKQGRKSRIKTPFIQEYSVNKFAARKFFRSKWVDVPFKVNHETIKWVRASGNDAGEFIKDQIMVFQFENLSVGDVVEVYYESDFSSNYGSNLFYFNAGCPKLNCNYTFSYKVYQRFEGCAFILPINVPDSCVKREYTRYPDHSIVTDKINLKDVKGINYPSNSFAGKKLPHVFADFRYYRTLNGSYPSDGGRVYDFGLMRPTHFQWIIFTDTTNYYTKIYDKQFASLRKFVATLPPVIGKDSSSTVFFKTLCDTFNEFRFITSNHLYYNESALINTYSGDHVLKRRMVEHFQWKLYRDILNDNKVFYYVTNVQDKRFGEHTPHFRASYAYEKNLIAVPVKNSFIYFMPRYDGMKYHLNELPFYLEGTLAALYPRNFQDETKDKDDKMFKFLKTHKGTYNENTRTENASVRISLDSLKADLTIKESLSGQFSTVVRHLYLNECIDSTISQQYFKKCVDKPFSANAKIKLSSKITEFPFRYNFNCSERITLPDSRTLSLKNWFSFPLSKVSLPQKPTHDYYFEFDFSDSYNFQLNFTNPVKLANASSFSRNISNDYFELESRIDTISEASYLVKVSVVIKKTSIPENKMDLLMDLVKELDALNSFTLEFAVN
jgi:hypothetical protein